MPQYVITDKSGFPLAAFEKKYSAKFWYEGQENKDGLRVFRTTDLKRCRYYPDKDGNMVGTYTPNLVEEAVPDYFQ